MQMHTVIKGVQSLDEGSHESGLVEACAALVGDLAHTLKASLKSWRHLNDSAIGQLWDGRLEK